LATISTDAIRQFDEQGFYAPIRALTRGEAADLRDRLEVFEAANSGLTGDFATSRICFLLGWTNWCAIPAFSTR
jgi:hypothetical protein